MTTIKLEIPSNDPSALFHMGEALRNIAKENGYVVQDAPQQRVTKTETVGNVSMTVTTEPVLKVSDEDFKEWHGRFITELATELQVPVSMLKGESKNVSEELKMENATLSEHGDSVLRGCLDAIDTAQSASVDGDDELLSPHVTVVEYEPATTLYPEIVTTSDELIDADGFPWDKRIHSRGKTRLADDTWRMARKPADKTDEEWAEFVDGVKAELKQLMDIPVATGETPVQPLHDCNGEPCVDQGCDAMVQFETETPAILDELAVADLEQGAIQFEGVTPNGDVAIEPQPIALPPIKNPFEANPIVNSVTPPIVNSVTPPIVNSVTPPIVNSVTPPIVNSVTPPTDSDVPPTDSDVPNTFPLFMKWLTTNNKKLTSDMVNKVLNDNGVTAIPLLTSRVDLIPQIHAELVKLL